MRRGLLAAALCCCCHPNPKIESFHVTPAGYCSSSKQKIHVDWKTSKGDTTLLIQPDQPAPQAVKGQGTRELEPHDMVITLTVSKGELHPHVIQPVRAVDHHTLNALAVHCPDGWAQSDPQDFGGGSGAFAPEAHPSMISNVCAPGAAEKATCRREAKVEHAGKSWRIPANTAVDVSADQVSMAGPWVLAQQLLPGEVCGTPSATAALEIDLSLEIGCTGGASYEQQ